MLVVCTHIEYDTDGYGKLPLPERFEFKGVPESLETEKEVEDYCSKLIKDETGFEVEDLIVDCWEE